MTNIPKLSEKILCAILYSGLFVPLVTYIPIGWIIFANVRRLPMKDFIKYHCYQALLFNMIAFFLPNLFGLLVDFISNLLSITVIFENSAVLLTKLGIWVISMYGIFIKIAAIYGIVWTLRGKYTYMPPISQAINHMLR